MKVDTTLLDACMKEDRLAQSALYRQCFHVLMGVCLRYVKNEQEAVEQLNEGFLKILRNLHSYKPSVPFEAWIKRIMINTMIDHYRKQKRYKEKVLFSDDYPEQEAFMNGKVYNEAERKLDVEQIERCIRKLPAVTQQVFNMFVIDGYSHKEISKMMEISEGTSKWHVSHGRKMLKGMIQKIQQSEREVL
ncbi:MAG: RNA polymerase sigma factor [Bacteroidota bacterium]